MKHLLKRFLIVTFFMGVMNHVFSQGLTITGTVEANDLTISGTVNVGSLTATNNVGILGNLYVAQSFLPANIITAGSLTATGTIKSQAISVAGTIAGGALSITNSGIVGGALSVIGAFSAGSMQIATVTGNTGFLQLRQLNDTYGESGLYIYHRNGSNGPIFYTGNNVDLVDLGYLSLTSNSQFNMRFEHRAASVVNTGNSAVGEFQMFNTKQSGTDVGTAFAAFGPVTSSMTSALIVSGAITSTGVVSASSFSTATAGGVNAGSGGVSTSGNIITSGSVTASSISTAGTLNASNIVVSGMLSSNAASLSETLTAKNVNFGFSSTAAGNVTLNTSSPYYQELTGSSAQTVTLPSTATLVLGESFTIFNNGTSTVTINAFGGNVVKVLPPNAQTTLTCVSTSLNTSAAWNQSSTNSFITGGGAGSLLTSTGVIGTTETAIVSTLPFASDRLLVGTVIRVTLQGRANNTGTATGGTFRLRMGTNGTTADAVFATLAFANSPATAVQGVPFKVVIEITIRSTGATGAGIGIGALNSNTATGLSNATSAAANATMATFNTTTNANIITATFSSGNAAQTLQFHTGVIEFVNR